MKIDNIIDLFLGKAIEEKKIIKTVPVDEKLHKRGIINIACAMFPEFEIDTDNKNVISVLFDYFTGNRDRCEKNQIDLNKGILIVGNPGSGKSALMQIFKTYTGEILMKNSFQYHIASEIIEKSQQDGHEYLDHFSHNFNGLHPSPITCYIDDVASKIEKVKHYGTEIDVIAELINTRYNVYQRYGKLTHFSSNLYPVDLASIYDERIISRLTEMCNVIELSGKDRRKN